MPIQSRVSLVAEAYKTLRRPRKHGEHSRRAKRPEPSNSLSPLPAAVAGSFPRSGAGSTGQRNTSVKTFSWSLKPERLARSLVQAARRLVEIHAVGARLSLAALVASALEPSAISGLRLEESFGSLCEIVERDLGIDQAPELFCFGLLEAFDIKQLVALAASTPVEFPH